MKTQAASSANGAEKLPSLVIRSLRDSSHQDTKIQSVFSQSTPSLDLHSTQYTSLSLSNSSSPPYHKQSSAHFPPVPTSFSLEKSEVKDLPLFAEKSEQLEKTESDRIIPSGPPASLLSSPVQDGKITFLSAPINISHTYHLSGSSSSNNTISEHSTCGSKSSLKTDDANALQFGQFSSEEENGSLSDFSEQEKPLRFSLSEESLDDEAKESPIDFLKREKPLQSNLPEESSEDEDRWIEKLLLNKRRKNVSEYLGEEERPQSSSSDQDKSSSFQLKRKNKASTLKDELIDTISPFRLDDAKNELSDSGAF